MVMNGVSGTHFAVWAPNAIRVSVVGDFNDWDGRVLPMHKMPKSGIFQLFVPGVKVGDAYRYEIKAKGDVLLQTPMETELLRRRNGTRLWQMCQTLNGMTASG